MSFTIINTPDRSGYNVVAVNTESHIKIIEYLKEQDMEYYMSKKQYTKTELETLNQLFRDIHPYGEYMREIEICERVDSKIILDAYENFLLDLKEEKCNSDEAMDQYLLRLTYPQGFQ